MKKLYLVTVNNHSFYFAGYSLKDVGEKYITADKIEFIADKVIIHESDRWDLLKEAYDFIRRGANTFKNEDRVILQEKIKKHLDI